MSSWIGPHRDAAGPLERRHRERRRPDDHARRRRRVGDGDDQVLLVVERVVEAVAAADGGAIAAADAPRGADPRRERRAGILVERPDRRRRRQQIRHVDVARIDRHGRRLEAQAGVDRQVPPRRPVVLDVAAGQRPVPRAVHVALRRQADERRRGAGEEGLQAGEAVDAAAEGRVELGRAVALDEAARLEQVMPARVRHVELAAEDVLPEHEIGRELRAEAWQAADVDGAHRRPARHERRHRLRRVRLDGLRDVRAAEAEPRRGERRRRQRGAVLGGQELVGRDEGARELRVIGRQVLLRRRRSV